VVQDDSGKLCWWYVRSSRFRWVYLCRYYVRVVVIMDVIGGPYIIRPETRSRLQGNNIESYRQRLRRNPLQDPMARYPNSSGYRRDAARHRWTRHHQTRPQRNNIVSVFVESLFKIRYQGIRTVLGIVERLYIVVSPKIIDSAK
jgi:hypothetical protein